MANETKDIETAWPTLSVADRETLLKKVMRKASAAKAYAREEWKALPAPVRAELSWVWRFERASIGDLVQLGLEARKVTKPRKGDIFRILGSEYPIATVSRGWIYCDTGSTVRQPMAVALVKLIGKHNGKNVWGPKHD